MLFQNPSTEEIVDLLRNARRIAVVGMSSKPERPSYSVARFLVLKGYEVIPVNPAETKIQGLPAYPSILDIEGKVDIVDVFRRSDQTDQIINDAIKIGASAIWLQQNVVNHEGARRAKQAGITFLQDICIAKELQKL